MKVLQKLWPINGAEYFYAIWPGKKNRVLSLLTWAGPRLYIASVFNYSLTFKSLSIMNASNLVTEQKTITASQWSEIEKLAAIAKIKNLLADLLESAPELNITDTVDFIMGLTERELKSRSKRPHTSTHEGRGF